MSLSIERNIFEWNVVSRYFNRKRVPACLNFKIEQEYHIPGLMLILYLT